VLPDARPASAVRFCAGAVLYERHCWAPTGPAARQRSLARGKIHRCARPSRLAESPPMNAAFDINLMTLISGMPEAFLLRDKDLPLIRALG
jgi:hypothetical protein